MREALKNLLNGLIFRCIVIKKYSYFNITKTDKPLVVNGSCHFVRVGGGVTIAL